MDMSKIDQYQAATNQNIGMVMKQRYSTSQEIYTHFGKVCAYFLACIVPMFHCHFYFVLDV